MSTGPSVNYKITCFVNHKNHQFLAGELLNRVTKFVFLIDEKPREGKNFFEIKKIRKYPTRQIKFDYALTSF